MKDRFNALPIDPKKLKKQIKAKQAKAEKEKSKPQAKEISEPGETELFAQAMQGVSPLADNDRGRQVAPEQPVSAPPPDPNGSAQKMFNDFMTGKIAFELEFTDEFLMGHVKGLDLKIINRLKSGAFSIEAHLDLHGLNLEQAQTALFEFIRDRYLLGKRCLLIITGRGKNSPGGYGVLKDEIQSWLTRDPLRRVVLGFCTALPKHGGAGAIYILLRKYKKSQGKVIFEKLPPGMQKF